MDELNSKFSIQRALSSSQQAELCNGSAPTSYHIPGLGNSSRNGSALLSSASSSQLAKESAFMEEVHDNQPHFLFPFLIYISITLLGYLWITMHMSHQS